MPGWNGAGCARGACAAPGAGRAYLLSRVVRSCVACGPFTPASSTSVFSSLVVPRGGGREAHVVLNVALLRPKFVSPKVDWFSSSIVDLVSK